MTRTPPCLPPARTGHSHLHIHAYTGVHTRTHILRHAHTYKEHTDWKTSLCFNLPTFKLTVLLIFTTHVPLSWTLEQTILGLVWRMIYLPWDHCQCWGIFLAIRLTSGCSWYSVNQTCCWKSYNAHDNIPQQRMFWPPNAESAAAETSDPVEISRMSTPRLEVSLSQSATYSCHLFC